MKNIFILLFFLLACSGIQAQAIVKGSGVLYTNGAPTNPVNISVDAEICIDTASGLWYEYNRDAGSWVRAGFRVQRKNISIAPTGAPGDKQSEIVINDVDSMYLWRSGAWRHLNKAGGDPSITNEGILGVGAGSGTSATLISNTSTSNAVTINAAGILAITESTSSNGGSITLTATEVDGSVSNEGSLTVAAGSGTTSIINSNTSGSTGVTVTAGTGLGISESGNTITLTNSSPDQTVALTGAGITAVTGTYPNFTITSTEVDGSITNELQTINNTSDATSHTVTLSNTGGSVQLVEGANVTLTTTGTASDGIVTVAVPSTILPTVTATDVVIGTGSPGYQGAVFAQFTSAGMDVSGGKQYNLVSAGGARVSVTTNGSDSTMRFTSDDVGSRFGAYTRGKNLLYYRQYSFFGGNENNVSGFNSEINGVNVITPGSTLTGVVNGVVNETTRKITLINEGSNSLVISNENSASMAANRFSLGADYTLLAGKMISFIYNRALSRWVFFQPQGEATDNSITNEGILGVGAGSGSSATLLSNTSTSNPVTINGGDGINISETTSSNGGQITIDAEDISASNEIQTLSAGDGSGSNKTLNLSLSGDEITLRPGTGIGLARSGDTLTFSTPLVGLPSGTDGQTLRNSSGTWVSNSFMLNTGSNIGIGRTPSKVLDVEGQIRAIGSGALFSNSTSPTLLLENSSTNGNQWYFHSDNDGYLNISESALGGSGINFWRIDPVNGNSSFGDAGFAQKVNIEGTARLLNLTSNVPTRIVGADADGDLGQLIIGTGLTLSGDTLKATGAGGGDPSITNEGSLTVAAGTGTTSIINSNTSGSTGVTLTAGSGLGISESGNVITLTNSSPDQTVALTGAGITAVTGTYPNFTLTSTEVDGSVSNELQTVSNTSNATSHTVTLSNTGGSIQLVEGTNITLTTTGTGSDGIVTIAATGGGGSSPVVITPSAITANQDNYSPTDWTTSTIVRLSVTSEIWCITGFSSSGISDGHQKTLINVGAKSICFPDEHPNSTAANRIKTPTDFILGAKQSVVIVYDATLSRWIIVGTSKDADVEYLWAAGSTTAGDWGSVIFTAINSGTTNTTTNSSGTTPAAQRISTASTSTGGGLIGFQKSIQSLTMKGTGHVYAEAFFGISNLSTSGERYTAGVFLGNSAGASFVGNSTVGVRYSDDINSGKWELYAVNGGGTVTTQDLGVTVAGSTSYKIRIEYSDDGNEARAYINEELKGIVSGSANMPSASVGLFPRMQIIKSVGTIARGLECYSLKVGMYSF